MAAGWTMTDVSGGVYGKGLEELLVLAGMHGRGFKKAFGGWRSSRRSSKMTT